MHTALHATNESEAVALLASINEKNLVMRTLFPPPPPLEESENTALLKKLAEGQDGMLELLERLIENKQAV